MGEIGDLVVNSREMQEINTNAFFLLLRLNHFRTCAKMVSGKLNIENVGVDKS